MPTSATAPASSRVASSARPKSVRLMKKYSATNAAIDTSAPTSCGTGRKMPAIEMVLPPSQEMRDAAIVRREEELRQRRASRSRARRSKRSAPCRHWPWRGRQSARSGDRPPPRTRTARPPPAAPPARDRWQRTRTERTSHTSRSSGIRRGRNSRRPSGRRSAQAHGDQAVEQPHQQTAGETLDDGLGGQRRCAPAQISSS